MRSRAVCFVAGGRRALDLKRGGLSNVSDEKNAQIMIERL